MTSKFTHTLFLVTMVLFCIPSAANTVIEQCTAESKSAKSLAICLDNQANKIDRELQLWVNNHVFDLAESEEKTGRKSVLKLFKRANDDFLVYRESNCRWYYLAHTPSPDASNEYKKCMIRITELRIKELADLKR